MSERTGTRVQSRLGWIVAGLLALALVLGLFAPSNFLSHAFTSSTESRDTSVVTSITREETVVLMSLGVQGLMEENTSRALLGVEIPWSDRTTFLQYSFTAKLGIDGKEVAIERVADDEFLISIPEFVFVGHSDVEVKVAVEDNGTLSWITPEIDGVEMVNEVLNPDAEREYLGANTELLQEQAATFYRGIVTSVDPEATVEFEFAGGPSSRP